MEEKGKKIKTERRDFLKSATLAGGAVGLGLTVLSTVKQAHAQYEETSTDVTPGPVQWGFAIDLRRCVGCKACAVACKTESDIRLGVFRASVRELDSGTYPDVGRNFAPWLCNHCKNPLCIEGCPVDEIKASLKFPDGTTIEYMRRATYQRPDGLVLVDQDRCTGCGNCVNNCPYGARYLDPVKAAGGDTSKKAADKCTMCIHRMEKGIVPACVNTCQADARIAGDLKNANSRIAQLIAAGTATPAPDKGTEPQCYYVNLDENTFNNGVDTK